MNKKIASCMLSIVVIIVLLMFLVAKHEPKYIMQDGVMLALTIDGVSVTSFPTSTNYRVSVSCENGIGKWLAEEWQFVVEDITGSVECYIDFTTRTESDKLKSVVESKATTNANGYRYSGQTPDNWVWFNNEMWRIIGSIPTCTSSECATSENLVKIIRSESIGGIAYDAKASGYTGAWGNNTLYTLLNTYYYGKSNGTETSYCSGYVPAKADCDYSEIGISASSYYGQMVKDVYWNTGASPYNVSSGQVYTHEIAIQTVSGHIGLANASDYGYAADSIYHSASIGSHNTSTITGTNWLYSQVGERTNTQSSVADYVLGAGQSGVNDQQPQYGRPVRPVLYLDSSVYVVSGEGTEASPYMIGM